MNSETSFDSDEVRQLRTAQGLSMEALARHCALSIRQLRQIEEGGHDAFYSASIKRLAQRKVLHALQDADALLSMQRLGHALSTAPLASPMSVQHAPDTAACVRQMPGH